MTVNPYSAPEAFVESDADIMHNPTSDFIGYFCAFALISPLLLPAFFFAINVIIWLF